MNSTVQSEWLREARSQCQISRRRGANARDVLERVAEAVSEVVRRVDAPLRTGAVMRLAQDAVRNDVPHGRVRALHVLLHAKHHLARLVLARLHVGELGERLLDRLVAVL